MTSDTSSLLATADKRMPELALHLILESIRDVAGSRYGKVLETAGLTRYLDAPPPADQTSNVTGHELARLYGATYQVMGESLTRLFLTNYGRKLPDTLLASPWGHEMVEKASQAPPSERLGTAVRLIAETSSKVWGEQSVSEDTVAFYLEVRNCAVCREMRNVRSPICASNEYFFGAVARALTGVRVTALEVECTAQGASCCKFRLRK